jgi:pyruvate dehydrogenase E2 component (dihydrolipoamide acetyltransferase)
MSKLEFKLPDIGEGVTEGEIVSWLVKAGDPVSQDQEMVEVMTDKATVTIGAPKAGRVAEVRGNVGDVVPVGQVLVVLDLEAGGAEAPAPAAAAPAPAAAAPVQAARPSAPVATAVGDLKERLPGMTEQPARASNYFSDKPLAAPATRKLARELGVDLRQVAPTGTGGRVSRDDVEHFAQSGTNGRGTGPATHAAPAAARAPSPVASRDDQRIPIRGLRKRIYENMARSKHTGAHFSYVEECNVGALVQLRSRINASARDESQKLSFLPFIVKVASAALRLHPNINCLVDDAAQEMILKGSFNIGIAVATDAGLTVPVLRDVDRLNIREISAEIERLANDARNGKTRREDLGDSSFTVSSLGKLGGLVAPPIVNYPEVAIMGVHAIKRRPVVEKDAQGKEQLAIGDVMMLSFTFDHRIVDGHMGAAFAQDVIRLLEEPGRLLLELT